MSKYALDVKSYKGNAYDKKGFMHSGSYNGTALEALEQIDQTGYAIPYQTDGRKVVKIGVKMNPETRTVEEWVSSLS